MSNSPNSHYTHSKGKGGKDKGKAHGQQPKEYESPYEQVSNARSPATVKTPKTKEKTSKKKLDYHFCVFLRHQGRRTLGPYQSFPPRSNHQIAPYQVDSILFDHGPWKLANPLHGNVYDMIQKQIQEPAQSTDTKYLIVLDHINQLIHSDSITTKDGRYWYHADIALKFQRYDDWGPHVVLHSSELSQTQLSSDKGSNYIETASSADTCTTFEGIEGDTILDVEEPTSILHTPPK